MAVCGSPGRPGGRRRRVSSGLSPSPPNRSAPEARGWLAVSKLSVNGTPVSNADLKKVSDRNGKQIPNGFWVYGKTVYVADGGPDGAAAMLVNHDSRLTRVIKVEGGQPVTVEYMAKAVETPAN